MMNILGHSLSMVIEAILDFSPCVNEDSIERLLIVSKRDNLCKHEEACDVANFVNILWINPIPNYYSYAIC